MSSTSTRYKSYKNCKLVHIPARVIVLLLMLSLMPLFMHHCYCCHWSHCFYCWHNHYCNAVIVPFCCWHLSPLFWLALPFFAAVAVFAAICFHDHCFAHIAVVLALVTIVLALIAMVLADVALVLAAATVLADIAIVLGVVVVLAAICCFLADVAIVFPMALKTSKTKDPNTPIYHEVLTSPHHEEFEEAMCQEISELEKY